MADSKDLQWVTVHGKHIPIGAGETKEQAIKKAFGNKSPTFPESKKREKSVAEKNEDLKEKQIQQAQDERDKLNGAHKKKQESTLKEVSIKQFTRDIKKAKGSRPIDDGWRVDAHGADEYSSRGCKCWTSSGGSTVAVDKDGDIISVCKFNGENISASKLMEKAIELGGIKLDSFSGNHVFYVKNGFEPVSWTPFNKEYAPDGWKESGCGEEEVVFYKYVGKGNVKNVNLTDWIDNNPQLKFTGDDGYDNAKAYRNKQLKEGEKR